MLFGIVQFCAVVLCAALPALLLPMLVLAGAVTGTAAQVQGTCLARQQAR